jgi:hypothetical protein
VHLFITYLSGRVMEEEIEKRLRKENGGLTYEEIMEILEQELFDNIDNPYKPLNFHDDDESF